jgi:AcrR family transcriptional regulator
MASKRTYRLKQRATEMAETRSRIVRAAVQLHGTVGPARTTLSAIARHAGVQRHTVYRHFPTEAALFGACSAHFFAAHPLPELELWRTIGDPRERLVRALDELYAYYELAESMFSNVLRDAELVDAARDALVPWQEFLARVAGILATGWPVRGRRRRVLAVALRHAVDFQVWRSLVAGDRLVRGEAVELVTALVEAAAGEPRTAKRRARSTLGRIHSGAESP